jgi:hypothetical protein
MGLSRQESRAASEEVDMPPLRKHRNGAATVREQGWPGGPPMGMKVAGAWWGRPSVCKTGLSRSLRRVLRALKPRAE